MWLITTWSLALSDDELSERIAAAVDASTEPMGLIRPVARYVLRREVSVCPTLQFGIAEDQVQWRCDALTFRRPLDGIGRTQDIPGLGPTAIAAERDGESIVVTAETTKGRSIEIYSVLADGRLQLDTTVTSPRLPRAMSWRVHYDPASP